MKGAKSKKLMAAQICLLVLVGLATFFLAYGVLRLERFFGPLPQWTVWYVVIVYGGVGILIGIAAILLIIKKLRRRA